MKKLKGKAPLEARLPRMERNRAIITRPRLETVLAEILTAEAGAKKFNEEMALAEKSAMPRRAIRKHGSTSPKRPIVRRARARPRCR